jgi:hypothetical protein
VSIQEPSTWNGFLTTTKTATDAMTFGTHEGVTEGYSTQEGQANVPIIRPVPYKALDKLIPYSLDETLWEMTDRLMQQYQRHFMIRRPGKETIAAITPYVEDWRVAPSRVQSYVDAKLARFLTAQQVDAALDEIHTKLSGSPADPWQHPSGQAADDIEPDPHALPSQQRPSYPNAEAALQCEESDAEFLE